MANYTKVFEKPYENGYQNLPSETTPITAETLNDKDNALEHIEDYLYENPITGGGTSDYEDLSNKPQINGNTLSGNKTNSQLGIPTTLSELTTDSTHRVVTDAEKATWNGKQDALIEGTNITIDENNVISATGGSGASTWSEISNKPFSTIGQGLTVENDVLKATGGSSVTVENVLTSTSASNALSANMGRELNTIKKTFHETVLADLDDAVEDASVGDMIVTTDEDVYYGNTQIDSALSRTSENPVQNKVVTSAVGTWTNPVSCAIGATSCTIQDSNITVNGTFDEYSYNTSNTRITILSRVVTNGQIVLTFSALEEATSFRLHIWG